MFAAARSTALALPDPDPELYAWINDQRQAAKRGLKRAISATDLVRLRPAFGERIRPARGSILASAVIADWDPEPDYFFDWLRDSAVVMEAMLGLACDYGSDGAGDGDGADSRAEWLAMFDDAVRFGLALAALDGAALSEGGNTGGGWRARVDPAFAVHLRTDQELLALTAARSPGDVRFNPDGTVDIRHWARPQHDGPALRALALMHRLRIAAEIGDRCTATLGRASAINPSSLNQAARAARAATDAGGTEAAGMAAGDVSITSDAPDAVAGVKRLLEIDLAYTLQHAAATSYDMWEEKLGRSYHSGAVQYAALSDGALLAASNGDLALADARATAAAALLTELDASWLGPTGTYRPRDINPPDLPDQADRLDAAVVLAALHAGRHTGRHSVFDDHIQCAWSRLEALFEAMYPINRDRPEGHGVAFGRSGDDAYFGGNPWFVTTLAAAEFCYRIAQRGVPVAATAANAQFVANGSTARELITRGDAILRTVRRFAPQDGTLPEQFDRLDGRPRSATDLTWSHAAFLTATSARAKALGGGPS